MNLTTPLKKLASLQLTLAALVLLAVVVAAIYAREATPSALLALPLCLLCANLLAAIVTNPVFRRQKWLLVFHIALLALVALLALGRLTHLKGQIELTEGEEFAGKLVEQDAGPLHALRALTGLRFVNLGFRIEYAPGLVRQGIRNLVEAPGTAGVRRRLEISEHQPLVLEGYRFYPTANKGFAPTFAWHPAAGGEPVLGSVHLPSYPLHDAAEQAREWTPPGSELNVWTMLVFDEVLIDPARASEFRLPQRHAVVLRIGERRWELAPGGAVDLPQGRLEYRGLRTWMGYTVFYDWTIPWLLAACLTAVGALGAHFWTKFAAKPWNEKT